MQQVAQAKQALEKKQEALIAELEPLKKQAAQMKEVQVEAQKAKALAERKDVELKVERQQKQQLTEDLQCESIVVRVLTKEFGGGDTEIESAKAEFDTVVTELASVVAEAKEVKALMVEQERAAKATIKMHEEKFNDLLAKTEELDTVLAEERSARIAIADQVQQFERSLSNANAEIAIAAVELKEKETFIAEQAQLLELNEKATSALKVEIDEVSRAATTAKAKQELAESELKDANVSAAGCRSFGRTPPLGGRAVPRAHLLLLCVQVWVGGHLGRLTAVLGAIA